MPEKNNSESGALFYAGFFSLGAIIKYSGLIAGIQGVLSEETNLLRIGLGLCAYITGNLIDKSISILPISESCHDITDKISKLEKKLGDSQ